MGTGTVVVSAPVAMVAGVAARAMLVVMIPHEMPGATQTATPAKMMVVVIVVAMAIVMGAAITIAAAIRWLAWAITCPRSSS
mgnify:CR=1 FL=1